MCDKRCADIPACILYKTELTGLIYLFCFMKFLCASVSSFRLSLERISLLYERLARDSVQNTHCAQYRVPYVQPPSVTIKTLITPFCV